MIYIDTSVVVAYYCPEPLSRRAERLVRAQARPAISDLTEVEFLSALSRKTRNREMPRHEARRIATQFFNHLESNLYTRIALNRGHFKLACDFIGGFTNLLRTLDALHLAVAASDDLRLVTADERLANSAESLGISVARVRVHNA